MKKTIRLTENDITRLVKKVIEEQSMSITMDGTGTDRKLGTERQPGKLPNCIDLMSRSELTGGPSTLKGPFDKITANFTVAPPYQGFTVHKNGKSFCFIKK